MWREAVYFPVKHTVAFLHSTHKALKVTYEETIDRLSEGSTGKKKVVTFRNALCIDPAKDPTLKISLLHGTFSSHLCHYKGDSS